MHTHDAMGYLIWLTYIITQSYLGQLAGNLAVNKIRSKFYMAMFLILNSIFQIS